MADNIPQAEETIINLITELKKIKTANDHIGILEKISKEASQIADNANKTSSEVITKAKYIYDQIDKAKLGPSLLNINEELQTNKKSISKTQTLLVILIILHIITLFLIVFTSFFSGK